MHLSSKIGKESRRRVLLIHPPYADYTYPYHSLSYVSAALKRGGYSVDVMDLNALWFRSRFTSTQVRGWRMQTIAELADLQQRPRLDIERQQRVVKLLQRLSACDTLKPERAVEIFRSAQFYDFRSYLWARTQVRTFEMLLADLFPPYDYFSSFAIPPFEADSGALVRKAISQQSLIDDFVPLIDERFGRNEYIFCGVGFPFSAQLLPGMAVFEALRRLWPDVYLVAGGTAISDVFKYRTSDEALLPLGRVCDFLYIGEAETAVVALADSLRTGGSPPEQAVSLQHGRMRTPVSTPYVTLAPNQRLRFQDYDWISAPPDYGWIDWSMYLAPEKQVNYSPARGCFWNKCTFCDYGLNADGPTAPSRMMDAGTVVRDLRNLHDQGIDRVYFAVDAIAPKFLSVLSGELVRSSLPIRWSTEFFLTHQFTPEFVKALESSGLVAASFGLESASDAVLERMGKGKDRLNNVLRPAIEAFRQSRIGLQPLFFFGFPGETEADRQKTVDFLLANLDVFSTVSKGGLFALLDGSMIAKDPACFGVHAVRRRSGENIGGDLEYEMVDGSPLLRESDLAPYNARLPHWSVFERPWAGGIDTLHTKLFIERYGRSVFHQLRSGYMDSTDVWGTVHFSTAFNLDEVFTNVAIYHGLERLESQPDLRIEMPEHAITDVLNPLERTACERTYEIRLRHYQEI